MENEKKKLTAKERKFCIEYIACNEAKQAAINAGYSVKTAAVIGYENLNKPYIAQEISKLRKEQEERTLVSADYVIKAFKEVAERCMQRQPVMEFDYENKKMVQSTAMNDDGEEVGLWEFDSSGANKALEMLGKTMDLFKGNDNQPVKVTVEIKQVP